ncbi:MAG: DNA repair protein RecO [Myxococcales bacterium]|nr:MAG: DNA repair protein RecO [Myxococcales bacterium]
MQGLKRSRAFVLRSVDQGESNRVISLFCEDGGRISAIAKGAKRSNRRQLKTLQAFTLMSVTLRSGRNDLLTIEEVSPICLYRQVLSDLRRMDVAAYVLSLLRDTLPVAHPEPRLFADLVRFFELLDGEENKSEEMLLVFMRHILAVLGHAPCFDQCGHCGRRPKLSQSVRFDPLLGSLVCSHCGHGKFKLNPRSRALLSSEWSLHTEDQSAWIHSQEELAVAQETLTAFAQAQLGRAMPARFMQGELGV